MTQDAPSPHALRVADLPASGKLRIDLRLTKDEMAEMQSALSLLDLRKVTLSGVLSPMGKKDWQFQADLGATVVQPCVATLEPVTTRIDAPLTRIFMQNYEEPDSPEAEMPEDDQVEALGTYIDPLAILGEALSLELPLYPRAGADGPVEIRVTEPGKQAMTDEQAKPFAGLAGLRDSLAGDEDG